MTEQLGKIEQLKPCPFCGGKARFVSKVIGGDMKTAGWELLIGCTKCFAQSHRGYKVLLSISGDGEISTSLDQRKELAEEWNRRAGA